MIRIFKIVKYFRGGMTTYYAKMQEGKRMRYGCWDYQLREWGENTPGGYNYGWNMRASRVSKIPKVQYYHSRRKRNAQQLRFNRHYLRRTA